MTQMTKSLLLPQFQFLLESSRATVHALTRTTAINNNIDDQGARAYQFNFSNQFKCIAGAKLRVFLQKVARYDPRLTFLRT